MQINLNPDQDPSPNPNQNERESDPTPTRSVRLPFLDTPLGLGDALARVTSKIGIPPCGGCRRRQESLNRVTLSPWAT